MKKLAQLLIILGIATRLILSVTTYHRDLAAYTTSSQLIVTEGHWFDFYDEVLKRKELALEFVYQPLAYFLPAVIYSPFTPLLNQFADGLRHTNPYAVAGKAIFLPLFIFKLPFLIADLLILFLLPRLVAPNKKKLVTVLWALNPVAIYVSSILGQIDIVLTLFLVAALISLKNKHYPHVGIFLALSALTKPTALLLFPLLALYLCHKLKAPLKVALKLLPGLGLLALVVFPFLTSPGYRATFSAYHLTKSTYAGIAISPGTVLPYFYLFYALTILLFLKSKLQVSQAFFLSIFAGIAFTHFHVQWFVWLTPWLILHLVNQPLKANWIAYLTTLAAWIVVVFSFTTDVHLNTILSGVNRLPVEFLPTLSPLVLLARSWIAAFFVFQFLKPLHRELA